MSPTFGDVMRYWRDVRRYSQLALSVETGISSRHISFLETGRSKPSRSSVLTLARVLEMPKLAINDALLAAGFSPEFPVVDPSDTDLTPMREAMMSILDNHLPMPAIIIDGAWQIMSGNKAAMHIMQFLNFNGQMNVMEALINDDPHDPVFLNWTEIAAWTLQRLQIEAGRVGGKGPAVDLYERLAVDQRLSDYRPASGSQNRPYLSLELKAGDQTLSLFSMMAEFTTAREVNMSEWRVEMFFPANPETKAFFEASFRLESIAFKVL